MWKNNFKIAFLNYTYGTNGIPSTAPTIVNLIEEEQIKKDIEDAKAMKADFIIVLLHWGYEYQINENKYQKPFQNFQHYDFNKSILCTSL